jgi:hypothetical protein
MSAVDRELHELELELAGVRRRTCDRMEEKEKTADTSLAYRMVYKGMFHSVIAQVSHLTQTSPLRNYLSEKRNWINAV